MSIFDHEPMNGSDFCVHCLDEWPYQMGLKIALRGHKRNRRPDPARVRSSCMLLGVRRRPARAGTRVVPAVPAEAPSTPDS